MNLIAAFFLLRRQRQINALLRERAGLLAERRLMYTFGTFYPAVICRLGEVEEHLRQLGHQEAA